MCTYFYALGKKTSDVHICSINRKHIYYMCKKYRVYVYTCVYMSNISDVHMFLWICKSCICVHIKDTWCIYLCAHKWETHNILRLIQEGISDAYVFLCTWKSYIKNINFCMSIKMFCKGMLRGYQWSLPCD